VQYLVPSETPGYFHRNASWYNMSAQNDPQTKLSGARAVFNSEGRAAIEFSGRVFEVDPDTEIVKAIVKDPSDATRSVVSDERIESVIPYGEQAEKDILRFNPYRHRVGVGSAIPAPAAKVFMEVERRYKAMNTAEKRRTWGSLVTAYLRAEAEVQQFKYNPALAPKFVKGKGWIWE
jgi:hypothetical protein